LFDVRPSSLFLTFYRYLLLGDEGVENSKKQGKSFKGSGLFDAHVRECGMISPRKHQRKTSICVFVIEVGREFLLILFVPLIVFRMATRHLSPIVIVSCRIVAFGPQLNCFESRSRHDYNEL